MAYRELIPAGDGPARRMIRWLSAAEAVDEHGVIADINHALAAYAAAAGVSVRTAWTDLGRLSGRGLVRQIQAAAPGYDSRYCLSYPRGLVDAEMPDLPADLARKLPHRRREEAQAGGIEPGEQERDGGAEEYEEYEEECDADPQVAADGEPRNTPAENKACGQLQTSPFTREGFPPPPVPHSFHGDISPRGYRRGEELCTDKAAGLSLLSDCRREWAAQRGWHRVPALGELADLAPVVGRAMRTAEQPSDVRQIITDRVASADSLRGVILHRLGRLFQSARRARHLVLSPAAEAARAQAAAARYDAMADQHGGRRAGRGAPIPEYLAVLAGMRTRAALAQARQEADRPAALDEIRAARERENARRLAEWCASTPAGPDTAAVAADLAEVRRLLAGTPEEQSRGRALAQVAARRHRA